LRVSISIYCKDKWCLQSACHFGKTPNNHRCPVRPMRSDYLETSWLNVMGGGIGTRLLVPSSLGCVNISERRSNRNVFFAKHRILFGTLAVQHASAMHCFYEMMILHTAIKVNHCQTLHELCAVALDASPSRHRCSSVLAKVTFIFTILLAPTNSPTRPRAILSDRLGWLLHVGGNNLTGTVPERTLNGTLPNSIGQWTALTDFGIYVNQFMGTLVDSIGQWTALAYFGVDANDLTGTLPVRIGQWTALTYFYGTKNAFTGTIPDSIGKWSLVESAFFQENHLVGTMPNVICPFAENNTDTHQVEGSVNCTCCTVSCVKE
jgi:hypothetical protein